MNDCKMSIFFSLESQSTLKFDNKWKLIEKALFYLLIRKQIIELSGEWIHR